jgi:hypothetical protein
MGKAESKAPSLEEKKAKAYDLIAAYERTVGTAEAIKAELDKINAEIFASSAQ